MASPLLFFPGNQPRLTDTVRAAGLTAWLDPSAGLSWLEIFEGGPDGGPGLLAYWETPRNPLATPRPVVDLEAQAWQRLAGDKQVWLGWEKANPPCPDDLPRGQLHPG